MNQKSVGVAIAAAALGWPMLAHATDGYFSHGYGMKAKVGELFRVFRVFRG